MAINGEHVSLQVIFVTIIYLIPFTLCKDSAPIPADKARVESWFQQNIQPISARKGVISPSLVEAEANVKVIKMRSDGSGDFKTLQQAIDSIQTANKNKVIISLAPGNYNEKIKIPRNRRFVTLYGADPNNKPILTFGGTAAKYGTFYSATLTVEGEYFTAVNVRFKNTAPRPPAGAKNQQAVALRIGADKAAFYSCDFIGFQDTLCDDTGRHFYKDCYVEGTIDFIFGAGRSLFLNTELHIIPGDTIAYITAQGAPAKIANSGYSFVHCKITGSPKTSGFLGRAWRQDPQVVYSFSYFSDALCPIAWSNNQNPSLDKTVFFGEYKNQGPRADFTGRYKYVKKFTDQQAKPFISLEYILGSKWLLPPPKL